MKQFVVYSASGQILRAGICAADDMALQARPGEFIVEGRADDIRDCVVDGVVTPRAVMPVQFDNATVPADGVSAVAFTGVPVGADVRVTGPAQDAFTAADDVLELTFDLPGAYTVRVAKFPYRDFEVIINAA